MQYRRNRAFVWEMVPENADSDAATDAATGADAEANAKMTADSKWMVKRSWVSLGAGDEDRVVIREGLRAGAIVVRDGSKGLSDKVPVVPQGLESYHFVPDPEAASDEAKGRPPQTGGRPQGSY